MSLLVERERHGYRSPPSVTRGPRAFSSGDARRRYASSMRIDFKAYADDYTIGGATNFQGVTVRALEDGRRHDLPSAVVPRDELCIVAATGPRGRADRRFRTRAYPMRIEVGPYVVVGYFHTLPTTDPFAIAEHRRIVALRPVRLAFVLAGESIEESHETLLLMRAKISLFELASDEAVGLPKALDLPVTLDPHAKDLTDDIGWSTAASR
jgi:hypothetical protein